MIASRVLSVALAAIVVAACSGGGQEELQQWMKEETKDFRGRIPPLPKVKPYEPVAYDAAGIVDRRLVIGRILPAFRVAVPGQRPGHGLAVHAGHVPAGHTLQSADGGIARIACTRNFIAVAA